MKTVKDIAIIFFVGLGLHRAINDLMYWIDPELTVSKGNAYFSVTAFAILYFTIKFLKERDNKLAAKRNGAVN